MEMTKVNWAFLLDHNIISYATIGYYYAYHYISYGSQYLSVFS